MSLKKYIMGKIIGIVSIKGGVGKTTSVVNIANILTKSFGKRVLVVDANFSAPNLRINLGLAEPKIGIHEMINDNLDITKVIYNTYYGFHILPAKLNNKRQTQVSLLPKYLERIREYYDFILIDSSPNVNAEIKATLDSSDSLFGIITPDLPTLSCSLQLINFADKNEIFFEGLILNKRYKSPGELSFKKIEAISGKKILAIIPHHLDVHESVLKSKPFVINERKDYCKEYIELAKYMILSTNPSEPVKFKTGLRNNVAARNRKQLIKDLYCKN